MVGFRIFARSEGRRLGLRGWVRNLPSGEVEVLAQGPAKSVEQFCRLLRQGPTPARVSGCHCEAEPVGTDLGPFGQT